MSVLPTTTNITDSWVTTSMNKNNFAIFGFSLEYRVFYSKNIKSKRPQPRNSA